MPVIPTTPTWWHWRLACRVCAARVTSDGRLATQLALHDPKPRRRPRTPPRW